MVSAVVLVFVVSALEPMVGNAADIAISWSAKKYDNITVNAGDTITFTWTGTHSVNDFTGCSGCTGGIEEAFAECTFSNLDLSDDDATTYKFTVPAEQSVDTKLYFGCSKATHCSDSGQKFKATVVEPAPTPATPTPPTPPQAQGAATVEASATVSGDSPTVSPTVAPTAPPPKVTGSMKLTTTDAAAFVADEKSKPAVEKAIASATNVEASDVNATLTVATRRLGLTFDGSARRLSTEKVNVAYEIEMANETAATALAANFPTEDTMKSALTTEMSTAGLTDYSISVEANSMVTPVVVAPTAAPTVAATTAAPGGSISFSEPCALLANGVAALALFAGVAMAL